MDVNTSELRGADAVLFFLRPHDVAAGPPRSRPSGLQAGRSPQAETAHPPEVTERNACIQMQTVS